MIRTVYASTVLSQLADFASSLWAWGHGGIETNPLAQTPIRLFAIKLLAVLMVATALFVASRIGGRVWHIVALAAFVAAGATFAVAWRNLGVA